MDRSTPRPEVAKAYRKLRQSVRQVEEDTRGQIEQVFGLTGGELGAKSWILIKAVPPSAPFEMDGVEEVGFTYWFEGIPDYLGRREFPDQYDAIYRTVVVEAYALKEITDDGGVTWRRMASYASSGETECPSKDQIVGEEDWRAEMSSFEVDSECSLCGAKLGDPHGMIYIGDEWRENIYRADPEKEENDVSVPDEREDEVDEEGERGSP